MQKKSLLYVIADASQTGAPSQVLYLLQSLHAKYVITLACPEGWLAEEARLCGVSVEIFDNTLKRARIVDAIEVLYERIQPDIIHGHGVRGGMLARVAKRSSNSTMIYTEHLWTNDFHLQSSVREFLQLKALRFLNKRTDHTIAVSEAVEQFLLQKHIASRNDLSVIYGAVKPITPRTHSDQMIIGTLGTLSWVKGVDILIKALPEVIKKFPALRCLIAGGGKMQKSLQQLALICGVESTIEWVGEIKDTRAFYERLSVYVQPSRSESFGMAPLEAMSAGLPVVVSSAGALPEIVTSESGVVFESGNHTALAAALVKLLSDNKSRVTMSSAAIERAQFFSIDKMAEAHSALYDKVAS